MSTPLNVCRVNGTTRVGSVGFAPVRGLHGLRTAPGHLVTHRARCRCRSSSAPQHGSGPARSPGIEAASSCTQVPRHPDTNTALRQASDSPAKTLRLGAQVGRSASGAGLAVQPIGPARLSKGPCSPSSRTAERGGTQTSWSAPTPLKLPIRRLGASENRVARTRAASEFRSARQPAARFRVFLSAVAIRAAASIAFASCLPPGRSMLGARKGVPAGSLPGCGDGVRERGGLRQEGRVGGIERDHGGGGG